MKNGTRRELYLGELGGVETASGTEFFVGLDLGQKQDHTAIAVVQRSQRLTGEMDWATYERRREVNYELRYLQLVKLGTPYPELVERVREVVESPLLAGRCTLVVDATGVGETATSPPPVPHPSRAVDSFGKRYATRRGLLSEWE